MTGLQNDERRHSLNIGCGLGCGLAFCVIGFYWLVIVSMGNSSPALFVSMLVVLLLAFGIGRTVRRLMDRFVDWHVYSDDA